MKARFNEDRYRENSEKAKRTRHSACKWCGGSIAMTEHFRRLVQRGENATMVTVFLVTHKKGEDFIDERAAEAYKDYKKLRAAEAQAIVGEADTSSQPLAHLAQSDDELWKRRGTYYGT